MDFKRIHFTPKPVEPLVFSEVSDLVTILTVSEQLLSVKRTPYYRVTCQLGNNKFNTTIFGSKAPAPGTQVEAKLTKDGDYINIEVLAEYGTVEIPVYVSPVDMLCEKAKNILDKLVPVEDPWRKIVCSQYVYDTLEEYKKHGAGFPVHHGYVGGMIEHVTEMLTFYAYLNASKMLPAHRVPVVLLSIVFHDYGKIVYAAEGKYPNPMKQLFDHIYISTVTVQSWLDPFVEADRSLLTDYLSLIHSILAHHKLREHGSPVLPATVEAHILVTVDKLSADCNTLKFLPDGEFNKFIGTTVFPTSEFNLSLVD